MIRNSRTFLSAGTNRCESRRPCHATLRRLVRWQSSCKHSKTTCWLFVLSRSPAWLSFAAEFLRSLPHAPGIRGEGSKHLSLQCRVQSSVNDADPCCFSFLRYELLHGMNLSWCACFSFLSRFDLPSARDLFSFEKEDQHRCSFVFLNERSRLPSYRFFIFMHQETKPFE